MRAASLLLPLVLAAAPLSAQAIRLRAFTLSTGPRLSAGTRGTALFAAAADLSLPWLGAGRARVELGTSSAPLDPEDGPGTRRDRQATLGYARCLGSAAAVGLGGIRPRVGVGIALHWVRTDALAHAGDTTGDGRFARRSSAVRPALHAETGLALPLARNHRLDLEIAARAAALLGGPDALELRFGVRYALDGRPSGLVAGEPVAAPPDPPADVEPAPAPGVAAPGATGAAALPAAIRAAFRTALSNALADAADRGLIREEGPGFALLDSAFIGGRLRPETAAALRRAGARLTTAGARVSILADEDADATARPSTATLRAVAVAQALAAGGLARSAMRLEVVRRAAGGDVAVRPRRLSARAAPASPRR